MPILKTTVIVTRISKNLLFNGMLYDNLMFLTYAITLILLGVGLNFNNCQWIGLVFIILGSILLRI